MATDQPSASTAGPILWVAQAPGPSASAAPPQSSPCAWPHPAGLRPAVFLDRDGVINHNRADYVKAWDEFVFLPDVFGPLRRLAASPLAIVIASNQSAVGRGLLSRAGLERIHGRMVQEIQAQGGRVDAACYCLHPPSDGCACRKPLPGQLAAAAERLGLDLARSYLIGDACSDMMAALAAGCTPILVLTGRGASQLQEMPQDLLARSHVARDLREAVGWILDRQPPAPAKP